MKKIFITLLFIYAAGNLQAQTGCRYSFEEAARYYEEAKWGEAINAFEGLIYSGIVNSTIYYNLGNAYYKNNQTGKAVLNYKRALRLSPRDQDIKYNLEYVLTFIKDENTRGPFEKFVSGVFNLFGINALTIIVYCLYVLLCVSLVFLMYSKRFSLWTGITLGVLLAFSCLWLYLRIYYQEVEKKAIVVMQQGEVKNGPGTEYSTAFTVPEGKEVVILEKRDEWVEIGLKEKGLKGWVKKEEIEKI